jgi:hypothetical protein
METADQYVRTQAIEAAKVRLKHASKIVELHASKILFKKTVKLPDCPPFLVRLEFPGVIRVFDPVSGELLAESVPGKPDQLNPQFSPSTRK